MPARAETGEFHLDSRFRGNDGARAGMTGGEGETANPPLLLCALRAFALNFPARRYGFCALANIHTQASVAPSGAVSFR